MCIDIVGRGPGNEGLGEVGRVRCKTSAYTLDKVNGMGRAVRGYEKERFNSRGEEVVGT